MLLASGMALMSFSSFFRHLGLAGLGLLLSAGLILAAQPKLAPELELAADEQIVNVIVRFRQTPDDALVRRLEWRGARHKQQLASIRSAVFSAKARDLALLAADPDVEFIAPDRVVQATGNTSFTGGADYGWMTVTGLSTPTATLPYDGTGVAVAVLDSGMDDKEDLKGSSGKSRQVYKESFVPGDNGTGDAYGHGNHVAGLIGGTGKKSLGSNFDYTIRGVAPGVNFVNLRVLDKNGQATDSTIIAAILRAVSLKSTYNIRVLNLSLGRPVSTSYVNDPLCLAVQMPGKQAWSLWWRPATMAGITRRTRTAMLPSMPRVTARR